MANDCLVTKLKGTVDNPSLLKIGEFFLEFKNFAGGSVKAISDPAGNCLEMVTEGVYFTVEGNQVRTVASGTTATAPAGSYVVKVLNKYDVTTFEGFPGIIFDLEDFKYSNKLAYLVINLAKGNLVNFKDTDIIGLIISGFNNDLYGDISNLPIVSDANYSRLEVHSSNITGNLAYMANFKNIPGINIWGCNITGSIESLVAAFVNHPTNPRTVGDIQFICALTPITFGEYSNFANVVARLKWNGANVITYQMGSDTDVADSSKNVVIYAKGASAEQISTWESQGNTVNVVS